jgi:hypothetical protein
MAGKRKPANTNPAVNPHTPPSALPSKSTRRTRKPTHGETQPVPKATYGIVPNSGQGWAGDSKVTG